MSKIDDTDFDKLFEDSDGSDLFSVNILYQNMKERKKNEYNFYNRVLEKINNLSEEDKSKFSNDLMLSGPESIKRIRDLRGFNDYIKLRNGLDYDHYNVYGFQILDDYKNDDLSKYLDKVSKHLYGKFYQDFILFIKGFQLLGKDSINELLQETNYENGEVTGYVEDCKTFYVERKINYFNKYKPKVFNEVFDERLYHNSNFMELHNNLSTHLDYLDRYRYLTNKLYLVLESLDVKVDKDKIWGHLRDLYDSSHQTICGTNIGLNSLLKHSDIENMFIWDGESELEVDTNYYNQKTNKYHYLGGYMNSQLYFVDLTDFILYKIDSKYSNQSVCVDYNRMWERMWETN